MTDSHNFKALQGKIADKSARIVIMGLGYVGLPLATAFAQADFQVLGLDIDLTKVQQLSRGETYLDFPGSEKIPELITSGRFQVSNQPGLLCVADVIVICVPTPLGARQEPDLSMVLHALEMLQQCGGYGQLVVLESTTYPGTTREVVLPRLGRKAEDDLFVAYSPERIDPGNPTYHVGNTPKVVAGITPEALHLATALYSTIAPTVPVSSVEVAEMAKIMENAFRYINIGFVNEMAQVCHLFGINIYEVLDAAKTKPYGYMPFYPGPGLGGHCIPVDPLYLSWRLRGLKAKSKFIELAEEVNQNMPHLVVQLTTKALNSIYKSVKGSRILVLGIAYKPDISDTRESPALEIIQELQKLGAIVEYEDPYAEIQCRAPKVVSPDYSMYDTVILTTPHQVFDLAKIAQLQTTLVDPRGVLRDSRGNPLVQPNIFRY